MKSVDSICLCADKKVFLEKTLTENKEIYHYHLRDVATVGSDMIYPNILLHCFSENRIFDPSEEKIMSLQKASINKQIKAEFQIKPTKTEANPVFYFVYNTDNYFHFLYDSLPYLLSYFHIRKTVPNLKLLMAYPNSERKSFYLFVSETLELLGIKNQDICLVDPTVLYKQIYVSSSFTYGFSDTQPPRSEFREIYQKLISGLKLKRLKNSKVYISRRSWKHGDYSNIGTNYTTRRKMLNEDDLVDRLLNAGFSEIFTETMTTTEKISTFFNAEVVVGAIGGGIANVLFSPKSTRLVAIVSPGFLDVNNRFQHSLNHVDVRYALNSKHSSNDLYKKYMRVQLNDGKIGEIVNIENDMLTVSYSEKNIAGWNSECKYSHVTVDKDFVKPLDKGLNSEWLCDIDEVLEMTNE